MKRLMQRFVSAKPGPQVFLRQHTVLTQWRGQTVGGVTEGVGSGQLVLDSVKEKGGASTDTPPYLFYPNVLLFYTLPGCHHILRVPELEAMIDEPKRRLLNIGHRGLHAVRNRNNGKAVLLRAHHGAEHAAFRLRTRDDKVRDRVGMENLFHPGIMESVRAQLRNNDVRIRERKRVDVFLAD